MSESRRQGFQPLMVAVESDFEATQALATKSRKSRKKLMFIGTASGALAVVALVSRGPSFFRASPAKWLSRPAEGLYEAPLTAPIVVPYWWEKHLEETCANAHSASARRLDELEEMEEERDEEDSEDDDDDEPALSRSLRKRKKRRRKRPMVADKTIYEFRLFNGNGYVMPYFGSVDLMSDTKHEVEAAVVFIHGAARNAKDYFCTVKRLLEEYAAENQVPVEKIAILAPKYHYRVDFAKNSSTRDSFLWWNGTKPWGDWRSGAAADEDSSPDYNSFQVLDEMLLKLSDLTTFPLLTRIVVAGHSAGGVLVQRYALVSHLRPPALSTDETLKEMKAVREGIDVRYVVANPSTFGYLDNNRWSYGWDAGKREWTEMEYKEYSPERGRRHWNADKGAARRRHTGLRAHYVPWGPLSPTLEPRTETKPFICRDSSFRSWPFGLNWEDQAFGNLVPYIREHPHLHRATEFYGSRDVIYLTGQNDTCTDDMLGQDEHGDAICSKSCWTRGKKQCFRTVMDVRCPAMLEGPHRHRRAQNFMLHLQHHFGKKVHKLLEVPNAGHDAQAMYSSKIGLQALFGEAVADADAAAGADATKTTSK